MDCYSGTASVTRTGDQLTWTHADPDIHVAEDLATDPFILAKYDLGDRCPLNPHTYHAKLREPDD